MGDLFTQTYYGSTVQKWAILTRFNAEDLEFAFKSQTLYHVQTGANA
jgi:hypothetical protein